MARIERRTSKAGAVSYAVRWRCEGQQQTVTLHDHADARALRATVELRQHRVRATDPDVRDRSIITGQRTRSLAPTLAETFTRYLDAQHGITASTRRAYADTARTSFGTLAQMPVDSITRADVDGWVAWLTHERGVRVGMPLQVLRATLRWAQTCEPPLRTTDPTAGVRVRERSVRPVFLSDDDAALLVAHADPSIVLLLRTALGTGLRQGELFGLQTRDLDLRAGRASVTVNRAVERKYSAPTLSTPKTANAYRTVPISDELAGALAAHVAGRKPTALVFPNPRTGELWRASTLAQTAWRLTRERAADAGMSEPDVRFHDLRHTYASTMLARGVSIFVVSRLLGHASIKVTADTYGHIRPDDDDAVRRALAPASSAPRLRSVG